MVNKTDHNFHANSTTTKDGWAALIVSWFSRRREKKVERIRLEKLLSYSDRTLEDIGLSRSKIIKKHGFDPQQAQRMYAVFTFPYLYLSTDSVITKNHTK